MSRKDKIAAFDPNGVGLNNGHFIGLPFTEEEAQIVFLTVPWDLTVSYGRGTAGGPANILNCSTQLDLFHAHLDAPWKMGLYMRPPSPTWRNRNRALEASAQFYIEEIEDGEQLADAPHLRDILQKLNQACGELKQWVYEQSCDLLNAGKLVGIVGGSHSVPLGFLECLAERYPDFGVLQIDAHMDLRSAYEHFTYSHASIFYNALQLPQLKRLVQVGIRDCCVQEVEMVATAQPRIQVFYDWAIRQQQFAGVPFRQIAEQIVAELPQAVYVSFDIDGLDPQLCPHTGTPVPGGLQYSEAIYLLKTLVESGRQIIGFDLCEVAGGNHQWDGNVGARVLYELAAWMGQSQGLLKG